jgi:hypothetical protein
MRRTTTAVLALVLVATAMVAVPTAMAQQTETNETSSNESIEPGAQLSGVVGVQEAELDGEVESRAYGIRVAQSSSDNVTAAVVADQLNATEERLTEIEAEQDALEAARENGSISEGQYQARAATLYAQSQSAERLANQTNETASGLPAETLDANGVNVTAIRSLQDRAANLTGPEVAAIAQRIAGPSAGEQARPDAAGNASEAPDRAGGAPENTTDAGSDRGTVSTENTTEQSPDTSTETTTDSSTSTETTTETNTTDGSDAGSDGAGSGGY